MQAVWFISILQNTIERYKVELNTEIYSCPYVYNVTLYHVPLPLNEFHRSWYDI